jgi:MFS family permease
MSRPSALLPAIFLLNAVEFLQSGMIAFGAGPIMGEIGAGPEEFSVIASLYAKQQWLIERIGWRPYLAATTLIFCVGALMCAHGDRLAPFAVGRVLMGLGGGGLMTSARLLVNVRPPGPGRFTGIKVFASGLGFGMAMAPLLAALVITSSDRSWIFYLLCIVMILGNLLAALAVPAHVRPEVLHSQGGGGRVLLLASSTFFLLYLLQRTYYDFYSDTWILIAFIALSAIGIYAFVHLQYHHPAPLLKVRELISRRYVAGMALFATGYVLLGANNYMIPVFLQRGLGFSWETTGMVQGAGLAAALLTWLVMTKVLPRSPALPKYLITGMSFLAIFAFQMTRLSPSADVQTSVLPALLLNGSFIILTLATAALHTFRDMQGRDHLFAHGYQLKAMLAQIATALGTALATLVLQWRSTIQYDHIATRISPGSVPYLEYLQATGAAVSANGAGPAASHIALAILGQEVARQATLLAGLEYFRAVSLVGAGIVVLMIVRSAMRLLRAAHARTDASTRAPSVK